MNKLIIFSIISALAITNAQQFKCPNDKRGQYPHPTQCDKYYSCDQGILTEKLCPDGLVFDEKIRLINKCDQPFNVDCEDRYELQPAVSNELCPRKNGFFSDPDENICDVFYSCIDGEAIENRCAPGLHFNEETGNCIWAAVSSRQNCVTKSDKKKEDEGFECPTAKVKKTDANGQTIAHPQYPHPTDCQKFFVCLNGIEKRSLGCSIGEVYNDVTDKCDSPENVPGCEDWYKETEEKKSA